MTAQWFAPSRRDDEETAGRESFYECTRCRATVAEWTEDCPRCGEFVVRVVEPPDGPSTGP